MSRKLSRHEQFAKEAAEWDSGTHEMTGWIDAPDAAIRASESKAISIRLPKLMIEVLKGFAEREGTGYQVLIKRWLDEKIRAEASALKSQRWVSADLPIPSERLRDCDPEQSGNRHLVMAEAA